jgi:hypothetical protein
LDRRRSAQTCVVSEAFTVGALAIEQSARAAAKHVRAPLSRKRRADFQCRVVDIVRRRNIVWREGIAAGFDNAREKTAHATGKETQMTETGL